MATTRRTAFASIASWFAVTFIAKSTRATASVRGAASSESPSSSGKVPRAEFPPKIAVSLKITDYAEQPGAYRWDAETSFSRIDQEPSKASTWGFREIGTLGLLGAADPASGYSMEFRNGPSPCSTWRIIVKNEADEEVVDVSFSFEGTPPIWPQRGAA